MERKQVGTIFLYGVIFYNESSNLGNINLLELFIYLFINK